MSASRNADAMTNQQGQFGSHIERDEPMTTTGHKPGVKASPNDYAPEFSAKTLPAGSAPSDRTFKPNNISEVPGQALNEDASNNEPEAQTSASETLGGTTSSEVHTGYGHPGQGMSSAERHHDGKSHREKQGAGLVGVGAVGAPATNNPETGRDNEGQRALNKDEAVTGRGDKGGEYGAGEMPNVGADEVASEQSRPRDQHLDSDKPGRP
ncbi:MAG: hypothetical protein M1827_001059 [Pycnora praestabilis]|nr:MAG: hypothetical protein M1827_001059 [Pycnora praestabilis]